MRTSYLSAIALAVVFLTTIVAAQDDVVETIHVRFGETEQVPFAIADCVLAEERK